MNNLNLKIFYIPNQLQNYDFRFSVYDNLGKEITIYFTVHLMRVHTLRMPEENDLN